MQFECSDKIWTGDQVGSRIGVGSNEVKKEGPDNEKRDIKLFAVESWTLNVALQRKAG